MGKVANMKQQVTDGYPWDFTSATQGNYTAGTTTLNIPNGYSNIGLRATTANDVSILNSAGVPLGRVITIQNLSSLTPTFKDTAIGSLSANGQLVLTGDAAVTTGGTLTLKLASNGTYWYWTELSRNLA